VTLPLIESATAKSLLGREHPLTAALGDVATTAGQIGAVAAAGGIGLVAHAAGTAFGSAIALAAALVAIVLAGRLLIALDRARARACATIIAGGDELPLTVVQRQRRRLLRSDQRELLAGMYEDLALRAERSAPPPTRTSRLATAQVLALGEDLGGVARLLRADALGARGVALAEQLLDDPSSPLYGSDVEALRCALRRIEEPAPRSDSLATASR
jgi:hypothetical protein